MKIFSARACRPVVLTCAVLLSWGCSGDDEQADGPPTAGQSGSGQGGAAGKAGQAGAAGQGGKAGQGGVAGQGGKAGAGGSGGKAGQGGAPAGGQAGASGAGVGGAGGGAGASGGSPSAGQAGQAGQSGVGGSSGAAGVSGKSGQGGVAGNAGQGGASGQGGAAGASGQGGTGGVAPAEPPFDWVGVIGTGQSLSIGAASGKAVSTKQPYKNLRLLDEGADPKYPLDGSGKYKAVPLTEPPRSKSMGTGIGYSDGQYPNNLSGETPHSGMANQISALWAAREGGDYITAHSPVGWSGHALVCIDKSEQTACTQSEGQPTTAYKGSLAEATALRDLAKQAGKTFGYGAVILTHGESDAGNQAYGAGIVQLQKDYEADLKAITGQSRPVPLLVSQTSTKQGKSTSAVQVWKAGDEHPGKIVCTGPKYAFQYSPDNLHMPSAGYVQLGEKYGEVFDLIVNQGVAWSPLEPDPEKAPTIAGTVITVPFHVPNPPLQWDEAAPLNHQKANTEWAKGRGFEVTNKAGQKLVIAGVAIEGSSVRITLAKAPAAQDGLFVGYAITQDGTGNRGGQPDGLRGDLRDSDDLVGHDAQTLEVEVTKGSKTVKSTAAGQFLARAGRDLVAGPGLTAEAIVARKESDDELTLSEPWTGATGQVSLAFHHDLRNYAVHFYLPVTF